MSKKFEQENIVENDEYIKYFSFILHIENLFHFVYDEYINYSP